MVEKILIEEKQEFDHKSNIFVEACNVDVKLLNQKLIKLDLTKFLLDRDSKEVELIENIFTKRELAYMIFIVCHKPKEVHIVCPI